MRIFLELLRIFLWVLLPLSAAAQDFARFEGISGPAQATFLAPEKPTRWEEFSRGSDSRLAVLLTDTDSYWLDLTKGLKSIGIPFVVIRDLDEALRHRVVLFYPRADARTFPAGGILKLHDHLKSGGTLFAVNIVGRELRDLFGFSSLVSGKPRAKMRVQPELSRWLSLDDPKESVLPMSSLQTHGYEGTTSPPLALFEDGRAAVLLNSVGPGSAYTLGIDLGQLLYVGTSNRNETTARTYANAYEPTIDVFLRFLKAVYERGEPRAATLGTVPAGKKLSILLTHDVDCTDCLPNALQFAALEKAKDVKATYFLQTKYVKDFNDNSFFRADQLTWISRLSSLGVEIGSHSVSHSRQFAKLPMGDGREAYPDYRPHLMSPELTVGATILGELRVSKFMIESLTGTERVVSFRPGGLLVPFALPEALSATGYLHSSSVPANTSLTHLPFQLSYRHETRALLPLFEFPITIEDQADGGLAERLPATLQLADRIASYGGLFVVLIHTDVIEPKLDFQRKLIEKWKDRGWFGTVSDFGDWWAARNQVEIDVSEDHTITLNAPVTIRDLPLRVPDGWKLSQTVPPSLRATQAGNTVLIPELTGKARFNFAQ